MSSSAEGPWLAAAMFCWSARKSADGTQVLDGIFSSLVIDYVEDGSGTLPQEHLLLPLHLSFWPGAFTGVKQLAVRHVTPSGKYLTLPPAVLEFRPLLISEDCGVGLHTPLGEPGFHWFEIYLDRTLITKVPLLVSFQLVSEEAETLG